MTTSNTLFSAVAIALMIMSAGCSGFAGGSEPAEQTAIPTQTLETTPEPTPKVTETPTSEVTETSMPEPVETESDNEEMTKAEKFKKFDENMLRLFWQDDDGRYVLTETFPENDSYHIKIEMRNTTNRTKTVDDRLSPLLNYLAIVEDYNDNDDSYAERDHTYIPDTVNVTFVTEDDDVFETRYIKYVWAWKYSTGDWSMMVYAGKYAGTVEKGPGYHEKWK